MRKTIIAGNWKMYKTNQEALTMLSALKTMLKNYTTSNIEIVIATPYTAISDAVKCVEGSKIKIGAENVYPKSEGAFTGEISPKMLKSIGTSYVIIGHSERREYFKETNEFINEKVKAVLLEGMTPILCIGEKLEERDNGKTLAILSEQIKDGMKNLTEEEAKKVVIAYEPVWAIGTGKTATPEMAEETHKEIRKFLASIFSEKTANEITIQYGGSMKPTNAKDLLSQENIDGGLIGGASLEAASFLEIIKSAI